jgi:hypothetical protein
VSTDGRHAGFSLVELGLAALILGLTLVSVLGLVQFGVRGTAQALHLSRAFHAARSIVDGVESLEWAHVDDATVRMLASAVEVPDGVAHPRIDTVQTVVSTLADGTSFEAKIVTVRVGWERTEGNVAQGEVVLRAVVARPW